MNEYQLLRNGPTPQGTTGLLWRGDAEGNTVFSVKTIELPWYHNETDFSCIPDGDYIVHPYSSPMHGDVFMVLRVNGRTNIEIHAGNWSGDPRKGFKTDSQGCILVGTRFGRLDKQLAVLNSRYALTLLVQDSQHKPFKLKIIWRENV